MMNLNNYNGWYMIIYNLKYLLKSLKKIQTNVLIKNWVIGCKEMIPIYVFLEPFFLIVMFHF